MLEENEMKLNAYSDFKYLQTINVIKLKLDIVCMFQVLDENIYLIK